MAARYYIGTSGWHYDHWRGSFYPDKLPKPGWLEFYAQTFATVELNNSFYHLPTEKAFGGWRDSTPETFAFAVKVSRFITHIKKLRDLSMLPGDFCHVFEFRHESWLTQEVFALLRRHGVGFCIFDMPNLTTPLEVTADFAYVRFHGSTWMYGGCYSDEELDDWAHRITKLAQGVKAVYVYFNNDAEGFAVRNALTLAKRLNEISG